MLVTDCLQYSEALLITACTNIFKSQLDALAYIIQSSVQWILGQKVGVPKFASERRKQGVLCHTDAKISTKTWQLQLFIYGVLFLKNNIHVFHKKLLI